MRTARKREMAAVAAALRRECASGRTLFIWIYVCGSKFAGCEKGHGFL